MAHVAMVGGGVVGLCGAMLLADSGHTVTVLERDPAPVPSPADTWCGWERRGVNQFRMLHFVLPRFCSTAERELPRVVDALVDAGAYRYRPTTSLPQHRSGGWRPGDERLESVTARRPVLERAIATVAEQTPGVVVRRGTGVRALVTGDAHADGVPHVVGVATDDGELQTADLVVDCGGRRSQAPAWLAAIGARPPVEEVADCGFIYYGRHFRSSDGSVPDMTAALLQPYDSISIITLPCDNGTWGVGIITSARDTVLRAARDVDVWAAIVKAYQDAAHWVDGEAISGVDVMAKIEDRHRTFWIDDRPTATGFVALGDAWAATNPSVGRGMSIGLLHAVALRDVLNEGALDDPVTFATQWHGVTEETVEPYVQDTLAFDRHRLAEIDAQIAGHPYETDDPTWLMARALMAAAQRDPDVLREYLDVVSMNERGVNVVARPGVLDRVQTLGANPEPPNGPSRRELVAIATR